MKAIPDVRNYYENNSPSKFLKNVTFFLFFTEKLTLLGCIKCRVIHKTNASFKRSFQKIVSVKYISTTIFIKEYAMRFLMIPRLIEFAFLIYHLSVFRKSSKSYLYIQQQIFERAFSNFSNHTQVDRLCTCGPLIIDVYLRTEKSQKQ